MVKDALPTEDMQGALSLGEPEAIFKAAREETGVWIDDHTTNEIREIAASLGVLI